MGKQLYKPASKASRALVSSWLTGSKPQAEARWGGAAGRGGRGSRGGAKRWSAAGWQGQAPLSSSSSSRIEAKNSSLEQVQSCMMLLWCCCGVYTVFEPFLHLCDGQGVLSLWCRCTFFLVRPLIIMAKFFSAARGLKL
jgi:hypothetical protein